MRTIEHMRHILQIQCTLEHASKCTSKYYVYVVWPGDFQAKMKMIALRVPLRCCTKLDELKWSIGRMSRTDMALTSTWSASWNMIHTLKLKEQWYQSNHALLMQSWQQTQIACVANAHENEHSETHVSQHCNTMHTPNLHFGICDSWVFKHCITIAVVLWCIHLGQQYVVVMCINYHKTSDVCNWFAEVGVEASVCISANEKIFLTNCAKS